MKSLLVGWEKNAVVQRKLDTGCIPTGYEYLLRSAGVEGIDYAKFQDELTSAPRRTTTRPSRAPSPASTRTCASLVGLQELRGGDALHRARRRRASSHRPLAALRAGLVPHRAGARLRREVGLLPEPRARRRDEGRPRNPRAGSSRAATRSGVSARRRGSRRSVEPLALATGRVVLPDARTSWRTASCSRSSTPFTDADGGSGLVLKVLR